jgi:hypothetical protein
VNQEKRVQIFKNISRGQRQSCGIELKKPSPFREKPITRDHDVLGDLKRAVRYLTERVRLNE